MQKKSILGIVSGIFALILWLLQRYLEVNNMITPQNSYLLLVGAAILGVICVGFLVWAFWSTVSQRFKKVSQLFLNISRLRITLNSKQAYEELEKCRQRLAFVEQHILDAENAIAAGNVNLWLDCHMDENFNSGWYGLKRETKPYFVAKINVSSRLVYDLLFIDAEHIKFEVIIDVDRRKESVFLEAMLITAQVDWKNVNEEPRTPTSFPHIQSLKANGLYFRLEISDDVRNKIMKFDERHQEPRLLLTPSWRLKTAHGQEVSYCTSGINLPLKQFSNILKPVRNQGVWQF
jgi:hypothetical protein